MKDFFENPEMLFGWPILVLGIVGLVVIAGVLLMALINPDPSKG
jgi:hypothetical protein